MTPAAGGGLYPERYFHNSYYSDPRRRDRAGGLFVLSEKNCKKFEKKFADSKKGCIFASENKNKNAKTNTNTMKALYRYRKDAEAATAASGKTYRLKADF